MSEKVKRFKIVREPQWRGRIRLAGGKNGSYDLYAGTRKVVDTIVKTSNVVALTGQDKRYVYLAEYLNGENI